MRVVYSGIRSNRLKRFCDKWRAETPLTAEFLCALSQSDLNLKGCVNLDLIEKFVYNAALGFDWVENRENIEIPNILFTLHQPSPMALVIPDGATDQPYISMSAIFLEKVCEVWCNPGDYLTQQKTHPYKMNGNEAVQCLAVEEAYHYAQLTKYRDLYEGFLDGTEGLGVFYENHPIEKDAELLAVRIYLQEVLLGKNKTGEVKQ